MGSAAERRWGVRSEEEEEDEEGHQCVEEGMVATRHKVAAAR